MFVHTFSPIQSPGLYRLLDLSLANITAGLECWRVVKHIFQGSSFSNIYIVLFGLFFTLVFTCFTLSNICSVICVGWFVLAALLLLLFLGLTEHYFNNHPLAAITPILLPNLCCCRLLQFSFFLWVRSSSFIFNSWSRIRYWCLLLGLLVFPLPFWWYASCTSQMLQMFSLPLIHQIQTLALLLV